uniref:Alpha-1,3-glucosyltransferase n=1 Tax=Eptatretus burgeri TaxID=7764 RepID=A0A8C4Q1R1_EPTBU
FRFLVSSMALSRAESLVAVLITLFKFLLIPAYYSTDFDVHRNWLAITHNLPLSQWYQEASSQWTLDYPPLFAWCEWILSYVAWLVDPSFVQLGVISPPTPAGIFFHRLSVIASDVTLFLAASEYAHCMSQQGRALSGALIFSVLLNLKHIFLYVAPAITLHLLCSYCFSDLQFKWRSFLPLRFLTLASIVIAIFAVSFGPFIALGQLPLVLGRLFPFGRGLCHAYWAANAWALYNTVDKVVALLGSRLGLLDSSSHPHAAMTGGLVGEASHLVLPSIAPSVSLFFSILAMLPSLYRMWWVGREGLVCVRATVACALSVFLFGWHVHEKAILLPILPLSILAIQSRTDAHIFLLISLPGHVALLPLIHTLPGKPVTLSLSLLSGGPLLSWPECFYIAGLAPLSFLPHVAHFFTWSRALPFLPLLITSAYCALGIIYGSFFLLIPSINDGENFTSRRQQTKSRPAPGHVKDRDHKHKKYF